MALSLPLAFKLARITDHLRKTPLLEPAPEEDRIPLPTAQAIIEEVRTAFPKHVSDKQIAQHTLNIFETLNARLPGALGTIGLMAIHGGTLVLVLVFGLIFSISPYGALHDFARAALRQPHHKYQPGTAKQWPGADAGRELSSPRNLLVATFKQQEAAATEFSALTPELPPACRLALFGDSLLLSLPASDDAARDQWFDRLQTATTNLFVTVSNRPLALHLQCIAANFTDATNLSNALQDYLEDNAGMHLVAPWSPEYGLPAFAAKRDARHFWRQMNGVLRQTHTNSALVDDSRKMEAAVRRGATWEIARLESDEQKLQAQLKQEALDRLRAANTDSADRALIDLAAALQKVSYTNQIARAALFRQIAPYLGEVKFEGGKPLPEAEAAGAADGMAEHQGLVIELSGVQMNDATVGLPALAEWLCDQHCRGLKYDLYRGFGGMNDEDPDQ
jgi:hypothetical protein